MNQYLLLAIVVFMLPLKATEVDAYKIDADEYLEELETKYPARSLDFWKEKVSRIKVGMTQENVMNILDLPVNGFGVSTNCSTGGARCTYFSLDKVWSLGICYDHSGNGRDVADKVIMIGEIVNGGWSKYFSKCEPVAGGDATR